MRLLAWHLCFVALLAPIYSEDVFGIVGENFTFPVEIKQRLEEITWKKNKDKVAEQDGQKPPTYFIPFRGRSVLKENGNLTIFNLEKTDAGAYELHYWDSGNDGHLKFFLTVLDPPSEPNISCSIKDDNLVLNCTSDFQRPVTYAWKLGNGSYSHWRQEFSVPKENVDATKNAICSITFSQTKKSSEISLIQCISDEKGYGSHRRHRIILIVTFFLFILSLGILVFLQKRGRAKFERGRVAQKNNSVHGSGEREQFLSAENQEQHNSDRATFSQPVHCENERPEADRELNKENGALKDKQTVNNGVNKEGSIKDHEDSAVKYGEPMQVAEGGNGEHLNNSPSCN